MVMKELKEEARANIKKIRLWCDIFRQYSIEAENAGERNEVRLKIHAFCKECISNLSVKQPDLLLALMDAYEVTRDEEMLQEVLDVVSGNLDRLEVSVDAVKLLAYCYYYVEEEECAERAGQMLEKLKLTEGNTENVAEAEKVLKELTGSVL